jgi:cytochrome bd ubiquinol oxidase subunit II
MGSRLCFPSHVYCVCEVIYGNPMVLPARDPLYSLTVTNAKAGTYGLKIGLVWWVIGISLAVGYCIYVYRTFAGKVATDADPHTP